MVKAFLAASVVSVLALGFGPMGDAQDTPVTHHVVSFISQGVTLRGTVYIPRKTPFAAAVWVDGAGETRKISGLGKVLAKRGLALLIYDKRKVGQSGGVYAGPEVGTNNVSRGNPALLAGDAAVALQSLRSEKRLRGVPPGFIGGSQAGWIIPLVALKNRDSRRSSWRPRSISLQRSSLGCLLIQS